MRNTLSKIPAIKLLLPFILGIIIAENTHVSSHYAIIISIICALAYFAVVLPKSAKIRLVHSYLINLPLVIICICIGVLSFNINQPTPLPKDFCDNSTAKGIIQKIVDNDFSVNMHIKVIQASDSCGNIYTLNHKMTAWVEGNDYSLREGDLIIFRFTPKKILNTGNPEEFDYEKYMARSGILYHVFIKQDEYQKIGHIEGVYTYFRNIQRDIINCIFSSSLNNDAKTFLIAIILGDSTYFNQDLRTEFSHAGIAHILALSGLHIGIIALLLSLFLIPLDYFGLKYIRYILTLFVIILFAFITGLALSTVRATIMIGFVIISKIIRRKNNSLNALLFSALAILIILPTSIYNIGFQFSFISVLLILLLSHKINNISPKNEMLYHFGSLFYISLISIIGTSVLTVFYFNYISISAIISNLILIPLLPIIILIGFIYCLFLYFGIDCTLMSFLIDFFCNLIIDFSVDINAYDFSFINNIYLSSTGLFLYIFAIVSIIIFIYQQKITYFFAALSFVVGAILLHYIENAQIPSSGYIIFNDKSCTPILSFSGANARVIVPDDSLNVERFCKKHKPLLAKLKITNYEVLNQPKDSFYFLGNKKIAIIKDQNANKIHISQKIAIDILLITKGYYGNIKDLLNNYDTKQIVLSNSIHHEQQEKLILECHELNMPYHNISKHGAIFKFFN